MFAGIISLKNERIDYNHHVREMLDVMTPPGKWSLENITNKKLGISLAMLSPVESAPNSPLLANDSPQILMFGELYGRTNQADESDASFVLRRYIAVGAPNFLNDLNGAFVVAIVNPQSREVVIATDHNNSVQVHYTVHKGILYFASEVKGLMALQHLPCELDLGMALMSLTSNMLQNLKTMISDVATMDGGAILRIHDGKIQKHKVWQYALDDEPKDMGLAFYTDAATDLIKQAVDRMTKAGGPLLMMTGGLDTRTIVSALSNPDGLRGVTLTGIGEDARHPLGDVALARRVANAVRIRHSVIRWDPGDVLNAIQNSVWSSDGAAGLLLEENVFDQVKALAQSGYVVAGDECCSAAAGGISDVHVLECLGIRPLGEVPSLWPFLRQDRLQQFQGLTEAICRERLASVRGKKPNNQLDELEHCQRLFHFVNSRRRMHMRHGLFARRPLLDLDYLNFLRSVPWRHRLGRLIVRRALGRINPELASIPYNRTREQVDLGLLIAHTGETASSFLFRDNPLLEEIFDPSALKGLLNQLACANPAATKRPRFTLDLLITRQLRWWLAAAARKHLNMRARALTSPSSLLLAIFKIAATLRHVNRRCRPPSVAW